MWPRGVPSRKSGRAWGHPGSRMRDRYLHRGGLRRSTKDGLIFWRSTGGTGRTSSITWEAPSLNSNVVQEVSFCCKNSKRIALMMTYIEFWPGKITEKSTLSAPTTSVIAELYSQTKMAMTNTIQWMWERTSSLSWSRPKKKTFPTWFQMSSRSKWKGKSQSMRKKTKNKSWTKTWLISMTSISFKMKRNLKTGWVARTQTLLSSFKSSFISSEVGRDRNLQGFYAWASKKDTGISIRRGERISLNKNWRISWAPKNQLRKSQMVKIQPTRGGLSSTARPWLLETLIKNRPDNSLSSPSPMSPRMKRTQSITKFARSESKETKIRRGCRHKNCSKMKLIGTISNWSKFLRRKRSKINWTSRCGSEWRIKKVSKPSSRLRKSITRVKAKERVKVSRLVCMRRSKLLLSKFWRRLNQRPLPK